VDPVLPQPLLQELSDSEDEDSDTNSFHYCPPGLTQDAKGCRLVWRILTLALCFPLCYPCYLTKHARQYYRKKSSTPRKIMRGATSKSQDGTLRSNTSEASPSRSMTMSSSRGDRDHTGVNVIFLKSKTGFELLNSLQMESVCKEQGVRGKSVITVGNYIFDLAISQEACLSSSLPEEIHNNAGVLVADIDCLVLVFTTQEELVEVLGKQTGIVGYTRHYWNGYFPLLLVQVVSEEAHIKTPVREKIEEGFSSSFRLIVEDIRTCQALLFDALGRFYLHEVKLQCSKLNKAFSISDLNINTSSNSSLHSSSWRCAGLCGLTNSCTTQAKRRNNFLSAARRKLFSRKISNSQ